MALYTKTHTRKVDEKLSPRTGVDEGNFYAMMPRYNSKVIFYMTKKETKKFTYERI